MHRDGEAVAGQSHCDHTSDSTLKRTVTKATLVGSFLGVVYIFVCVS